MQTIKDLRRCAALTTEELAEKAGVSAASISRIENGISQGRASTLRKLAQALDISPADVWQAIEATNATNPKGQA